MKRRIVRKRSLEMVEIPIGTQYVISTIVNGDFVLSVKSVNKLQILDIINAAVNYDVETILVPTEEIKEMTIVLIGAIVTDAKAKVLRVHVTSNKWRIDGNAVVKDN